MSNNLLLAVLVFVVGCAPFARRDASLAIAANAQAQGQAMSASVRANARTDLYAAGDPTWLCPDESSGRAAVRCEGGVEVKKNYRVTVVGPAPNDGVWSASLWDGQADRRLYVAATAVHELPDTAELDSFAADLDKRFPTAKRIPLENFTYDDLLAHPSDYRGRYLVVRQASGGFSDQTTTDGALHFTVPVPITRGSRQMALAQFELKSPALVAALEKGDRTYSCSVKYCDQLVMVAVLTGKTVDRADKQGKVHRLPLFSVLELADRYGAYKSK